MTTSPSKSSIYYIIRDEATQEQLCFYPLRIKSDAHRIAAAIAIEMPDKKPVVIKKLF